MILLFPFQILEKWQSNQNLLCGNWKFPTLHIRMICVYELIIVDAFLQFESPFKLNAEMIIFVMSHLINDILNFNNLMHIWVQMVGTG